jgi:hypothetical protein
MRVFAEITLGSGTVWEVEYKDCKTTRPRNAVTLAIDEVSLGGNAYKSGTLGDTGPTW